MPQLMTKKDALLNHVAEIIEKLIEYRSIYQERLKKDEVTKYIVELFDKFSTEELRAIPDDELTKRIDSILMIEAVAGTLNDFTPEEMRIFDEAVEGR